MTLITALFLALAIVYGAFACSLSMLKLADPLSAKNAKDLAERADRSSKFFGASIIAYVITEIFSFAITLNDSALFTLSLVAGIVVLLSLCSSFGGLNAVMRIKASELSAAAVKATVESKEAERAQAAGAKAGASKEDGGGRQ